jgi:SAM-dependent methyltransferase
MADNLRFTEDLPQLATESFDLAGRLCSDCQNFHMLWPYHRLAQAAGGDVEIPLVQSALRRLLSPSGRKILIAGCADSGLLAVVARAASAGTSFTVLDRCQTPLELCRRFADRWSFPIATLHTDLQELSVISSFDVVFVHMLLQFIPPTHHLNIFSRLRRSLRPGGHMVLVFRTSPRIEASVAASYRHDYPRHLIEQLETRGVPLPESRQTFQNRLEVYFEDRRRREGTHGNRAEVESLITAAGFEIEELIPIVAPMSAPFVQFAAKIGLQRFLVVASAI